MNSSFFHYQARNVAKTYVIMTVFLVVIIALGYWLSARFANPVYLYIGVGFSLVMNIVAYWFSDKIALASTGAKPMAKSAHPGIHYIVEDLCRRASLPVPRLYLIEDTAPNAFATGRDRDHAVVAMTTGLLHRLNDDELRGVLAHELAHIGNRDILVMTVTTIIAGFIAMIADVIARMSYFGSDEERSPVIGIVFIVASSVLANIGALLITAAVSRRREFLADETAAHMCGNSHGLASALHKLDSYKHDMRHATHATAHLFIVNPFSGGGLSHLFSTHPPMHIRIERLQRLQL